MSSHTGAIVGVLVGALLGLAGAPGGFGAFLVVLVLSAIGLFVGLVVDGTVDLGNYPGDRRDRTVPMQVTLLPTSRQSAREVA